MTPKEPYYEISIWRQYTIQMNESYIFNQDSECTENRRCS